MTFLFHSYSFDNYKWNINFILLLIVVNKNCKMNVLKMNSRGAMTPCHSHIDLLLTLNSRSSGGPKTKYRKYNYYKVVNFFQIKCIQLERVWPYIIVGNPPLVSHTLTGRGPINWTFLLFMNIYISIHHAIRQRNVLVFGNTKMKIMLWKKWMPVQALMRFVNESVKDHINRIRHGLFKRTRKVKPDECKWDWPRVDDTLFIKNK